MRIRPGPSRDQLTFVMFWFLVVFIVWLAGEIGEGDVRPGDLMVMTGATLLVLASTMLVLRYRL